MNSPDWLKPLLIGSVIGAAVLGIGGFSWAGWMTSGKAQVLAADQSSEAVVTALAPFCVLNANNDPDFDVKLAALSKANNYDRSQMIMDNGWSTIEGNTGPDRRIAGACLEKLADRM